MEFKDGMLAVNFNSSINCMECGEYCYCPPSSVKLAYVEIEATLNYLKNENDEELQNEPQQIGKANIKLFDQDLYSDFFDLADVVGGDLFHVIEAAFNNVEDYGDWSTVVVLDNLEIIESMRGEGAGSLFLKAIQEYAFKVLKGDAMLLVAANRYISKDDKNKQASTNRLIDFYRRFEFEEFEENNMYCTASSYWGNVCAF